MYDNKVRISPDVLSLARQIAERQGMKNHRAAIETVFRNHAAQYLASEENGSEKKEFAELGDK